MREIIQQLRPDASIQDFMDKNTEWSNERSRQLQVVAKYITTQTLLHSPYYDAGEIVHDSFRVLSDIDTKVIALTQIRGKKQGFQTTN